MAATVLPVVAFAMGAIVMFADISREFQVPCPPVYSPKSGIIQPPPAGSIAPRSLARPASMPRVGRLARLRGEVHVAARVETDGRVSRVELLRSSGVCPYDVQAMADVRRWKFRPAHRAMGEVFAAWMAIRVIYSPDRRPRFEPQRFDPRTGENI